MNSLQSFIEALRSRGDLKVFEDFVDPNLEIAEIADREMKQPGGGKALLFSNTGTKYPLLINMYGSQRRISDALYCNDPAEKSEQMYELFRRLSSPKASFMDKVRTLPLLGDIAGYFPKTVGGRGKCQEVVDDDIDIFSLPVLKCWPHDGGKFITLPMVNTVDPNTGIRNVGMYRVQLLDMQTTAMHWHLHKTGARHYNAYKKLGRRMPCAIVLGGDPVYTYCATAPLPDGIDEYLLAGFLRNRAVRLVSCITQPEIKVPEDADFVIEGYLDPEEDLVMEGPFGDHTGFYSLADYYPKFHITCITHRRDAVYPATIVGVPPMEDAYISIATERIFRFPISMAYAPEMLDLHMPPQGVEHNITIVKIDSQYPANALRMKNAMWGAGQMMFNKILMVYSGAEDIRDYKVLMRDAMRNYLPMRDTYIDSNGVSDVLDHSSRHFVRGGKICLDCTPGDGGEARQPAADISKNMPDIDGIKEKYPQILNINASLLGEEIPIVFISVKDKKTMPVAALMEHLVAEGMCPKILVAHDADAITDDIGLLAWYASGNIDPSVDCRVLDTETGGVLCVDSTAKTLEDDGFERQWPEVVMMDEKTIKSVDGRKNIENFEKLMPSPSIKLQKLRYNNGAVRFFNSK